MKPRKKKKIILTSFINVGPYKSAEEIRREEEKAAKAKWMNRSGFVTTYKPKKNYIANYVQGTPG